MLLTERVESGDEFETPSTRLTWCWTVHSGHMMPSRQRLLLMRRRIRFKMLSSNKSSGECCGKKLWFWVAAGHLASQWWGTWGPGTATSWQRSAHWGIHFSALVTINTGWSSTKKNVARALFELPNFMIHLILKERSKSAVSEQRLWSPSNSAIFSLCSSLFWQTAALEGEF